MLEGPPLGDPAARRRLESMARILAVTGGYVVPVSSDPIEDGTVIVTDGVITAVGGPDTAVPEGAEVVDASGSWVVPGFVEAHGHLGVHEDGEGWSGNDTNEMTDPNGAAVPRTRRHRHRRGRLPRRPARRRDDGRHQARLGQPDRRPHRRDQDLGRAHGRRADRRHRRVGEVGARREPEARVRREEAAPSTRLGVASVLRDAFVARPELRRQARRGRRQGRAVRSRPRQGDARRGTVRRARSGTSTATVTTTSPRRSGWPRSSATR